MKKLILFGLLVFVLATTSACGGTKKKTLAPTETENATSSTSSTGQKSASNENGVISKSQNAISGKENKEVLDQMDTELDSILNSINESDSVDDDNLANIE